MLLIEKLPAGDSPSPGLEAWQRMLAPDGSWLVLRTAEASAKTAEALDIPPGKVRWAGVFPESLVGASADGLAAIGDLKAAPPALEELNAADPPSALLPVPPGVNLAAQQEWVPFGVEERVRGAEAYKDTTAWTMKSGAALAGLYASRPWRLPRMSGTPGWSLSVTAQGTGQVQIGIAMDTGSGSGFGDASVLGTLDLAAEPHVTTWKLPAEAAEARQIRLVLLSAPATAGEVTIPSVIFSTNSSGTSPPQSESSAMSGLGVWNWSTEREEWSRLKPLWRRAGIDLLQLALPRELASPSDALHAQLQAFRQEGFRVVAVEGDPHMILPQSRPAVLERHRALDAWQGQALDAIQYDVEPYLLPGFRVHGEKWQQQWSALYEALALGKGVKVEPVVPFWLLTLPGGEALLEQLARHGSRIVVMNYRSDAGDAAAWATLWLEWSLRHECPVALAVECGPVADSVTTIFLPAERGTLWVKPWPGQGTAAVLYEAPVPASFEGARTFALDEETVVSGKETSLRDSDPAKVEAWLQTMRDLAGRLKMPAPLAPRLLLHEPPDSLLERLAERREKGK